MMIRPTNGPQFLAERARSIGRATAVSGGREPRTLRLVMAGYLMRTIGFTEDEVRERMHRYQRAALVASWWHEGF